MFICKYCSLNFVTEQIFNFHIKKCREINTGINKKLPQSVRPFSKSELCKYCSASVPSDKLVAHSNICKIKNQKICEYCSEKFTTVAELIDHDNTCKIKKSTILSKSEHETFSDNKTFPNMLLETCKHCYQSFDTSEELVAHRKICIIKKMQFILDQLAKIDAMWSRKQSAKILTSFSSSPSSDHSVQNLSNDNQNLITSADLCRAIDCVLMPPPSPKKLSPREPCVQKSSKKRHSDTRPDIDCSTISEIYLESPSPPKIFRFDDKDLKKIEKIDTEQEIAIGSKICHTNISIHKSKTSCEYCSMSFKTEAELLAHSGICDSRNACTKETFECVFCLLQFQSLDAITIHISQCFKNNTEDYLCPDCGNLFWTIHKLAIHKTFSCKRKSRRQLRAIGKWKQF